jgi:hypothetical protein
MELTAGARIYHTHRRETGTVQPIAGAPDTTFVLFDGAADVEEVSRDLLAPGVTAEALEEARLDGRDLAIKDVIATLRFNLGEDDIEDIGILAAIEIISANYSTT